MTFSGSSARQRRRRLALDLAGRSGRSHDLSRRATARLRPPDPDEWEAQADPSGWEVKSGAPGMDGVGPGLAPMVETDEAQALPEPANGHAREPFPEEREPQPVRFKWDPRTGQAVPVNK